jgi:hypothetical protein
MRQLSKSYALEVDCSDSSGTPKCARKLLFRVLKGSTIFGFKVLTEITAMNLAMKNLILASLLLIPHFAMARRPAARANTGSYTMSLTFFKCVESPSGLCAKDIKDGGGSVPYVTYRTNVVYEVDHCPEFSSKILERMKVTSTDNLGATIEGFTITGNGFSTTDQLIVTNWMQ